MGYSINTPEHHYIEWYTWDHESGTKGEYVTAELYHRLEDPHETTNIADTAVNKAVVERLSQQLAKGWKGALEEVEKEAGD